MHIHSFQHDHFEDLGFIGEWAANQNFTTSVTRLDLKPEFPSHNEYDWLIILGGKMGVNDFEAFPWLHEEISYINQAIRKGKTVIGICLGSQLIAAALGSKVYKNTEPEIGFWPVSFHKHTQDDGIFKHFPAELKLMHVHFDIFDLPKGATAMASSEVTPCQAFRFGNNVFAFQFHFEISSKNAKNFIQEITPEIVPGKHVQYPSAMVENINSCVLNNQVFSKVLDEILQSREPF